MIPKAVRDELGLGPGDRVTVEAKDGEARVRRALSLDELVGIFADEPGDTLADLEREHREEIERDERRWP